MTQQQPQHTPMMATQMVHCPSGQTPCCDRHARMLKGLMSLLGSHVVSTILTEPAECTNCVNEARGAA